MKISSRLINVKHCQSGITVLSIVFIQIDAHSQIDAHLPHHQAPGTQKYVKSRNFYQKCMYLRSDFELIIYALSSCLAHAQCATIRMNTVYMY